MNLIVILQLEAANYCISEFTIYKLMIIQDRVNQGHFLICWATGKMNLADYFTKHHPVSHHKLMRPFYVHKASYMFQQAPVQGCIGPAVSDVRAHLRTQPHMLNHTLPQEGQHRNSSLIN